MSDNSKITGDPTAPRRDGATKTDLMVTGEPNAVPLRQPNTPQTTDARPPIEKVADTRTTLPTTRQT